MPYVTPSIGGRRHDVTRAPPRRRGGTKGGEPSSEGAAVVLDAFRRTPQDRAYSASEPDLGSCHVRTFGPEDPQATALPVSPVRRSRHRPAFLDGASGVDRPHDLVGQAGGKPAMHGHDAGDRPDPRPARARTSRTAARTGAAGRA